MFTCLHQSTYCEKKSRFLVYVYSLDGEEDFKQILDKIQEENPKARHFLRCGRFANRYGVMSTTFSEDREPVSSMHRLSQLMERKKIENRAVFLVRYFGGTKLGASHLDSVYFDLAVPILKL